MRPALLVIAKAPVPGRVKTRLCPPCTYREAAALASASLADTIAAADAASAARRTLVLAGTPAPRLPAGWTVLAQRGDGLAERLAAAFADAGAPALLVGMDTPQLTAKLLDEGLAALDTHDAVIGPAVDGGYWAIGLRRPDPVVFAGIPMSDRRTGAAQLARLEALGLDTAELPPLRDVDTIADARAAAQAAPESRFAAVLRETMSARAAA